MMQFTKVDDDAYTVLMNLDTINEIGYNLVAFASSGSGSERSYAIGNGFVTAHKKLSEPETSEESVEVSE